MDNTMPVSSYAGSEATSSSTNNSDLDVNKIVETLWGDKKKINIMKSIWTSTESDSSSKGKVNQEDQQRVETYKASKYAQSLYQTSVSLAVLASGGNGSNGRYLTIPVRPAILPTGSRHGTNGHYLPIRVPPAVLATSCNGSNGHYLPAPVYKTPYNIQQFQPFAHVENHKELGQLVQCFMSIESLDYDIKTCEQFLGIKSLRHPLHLPTLYDMNEIARLFKYSEKQLEWYIKFSDHVKTRFVLEEKRRGDHNKSAALWNAISAGISWTKDSFEGIIFSTMLSIANKWNKANNSLFMLLSERQDRSSSNRRLFPVYFKELVRVVLDAKTSVWALSEKIKMIENVPVLSLESFETARYLTPIPFKSSSCSYTTDTTGKSVDGERNFRRRRGKNFKKF